MCACLPCVAHVLVWFDLVTFFALLLPWCATCIHELESVIIIIVVVVVVVVVVIIIISSSIIMHTCIGVTDTI